MSSTTYHRWMAEGDKPDAPEHYRAFREAVDEALGAAADLLLAPLRESGVENSRYLLTHMFPDEFGSRSRVEHTGEGGGPMAAVIQVTSAQFDAALDAATRDALKGGSEA